MKRLSVFSLFLLVLLWGTVRAVDPDGDINIDGDVDIVDVLWGYQALTGMRVLDPDQQGHGDVAPLVSGVPVPNDVFDLGDVLVIQRKALGLIDFSYCGDGIVQEVEQCDDGNAVDDDGCTNSCLLAVCGDAIVQSGEGEQCDDGNAIDNDGCTSSCQLPFCGDAIIHPGLGEQCDDANPVNDDGCTNSCQLPVCGDAIVQPGEGEQCDDGNAIDNDGCTNSCQLPFCGDAIIHPGLGEQCDDANPLNDDGCTNSCQLPACGDAIVQSGEGEQCDDANAVNDDGCTNGCLLPACGDAIVQPGEGEQCDDGNGTNDDGCSNSCQLPACGDAIVQSGEGEECDDANAVNDDSCTNGCLLPVCGDAIVQAGAGEQCDDGNTNPGDGCDSACQSETALVPLNQFNIGDSIGEGEAANGTIGEANHETVWSTGYDASDSVNALNERFEVVASASYYENDPARDPVFNKAMSGDEMVHFAGQAQAVINATAQVPSGLAGQVTVLLGNNDVCASSIADMTDPGDFEMQYRAGLDVLASDASTRHAQIYVSGIPAIYWLWNAKRNDFLCRLKWPFVPCQNLLAGAGDDCESGASREDPDNVYPGDGPNCQRRKEFHALIRDTYNPILRDVLEEYRDSGDLPNASYIDIFDVRFDSQHVNGGDCFHPSEAGHALLSETQWCRTQWGEEDPQCTN